MTRTVSVEEFQTHTTKEQLWCLLHEKVYDVSKFIDEHPGGDEVIMAEAGKDATEAFEDIGHSDEARELLAGLMVGNLEENGLEKMNARRRGKPNDSGPQVVAEKGYTTYFVPLAGVLGYFAWRWYSGNA